jgi:hypothetical protein
LNREALQIATLAHFVRCVGIGTVVDCAPIGKLKARRSVATRPFYLETDRQKLAGTRAPHVSSNLFFIFTACEVADANCRAPSRLQDGCPGVLRSIEM